MATSLGEGKLNSNLLNSALKKKNDLVPHSDCAVGLGKYILSFLVVLGAFVLSIHHHPPTIKKKKKKWMADVL